MELLGNKLFDLNLILNSRSLSDVAEDELSNENDEDESEFAVVGQRNEDECDEEFPKNELKPTLESEVDDFWSEEELSDKFSSMTSLFDSTVSPSFI